MIRQRTIAKRVSVTGVGIHSGRRATIALCPAPAGHGVRFERTDLRGRPVVRASTDAVGATDNNTTIGKGEEAVHTVEHLLAALYGLGIDNLHVEIDGPEVPIMDGSSTSFVFLLREAGVSLLGVPKSILVVLDPVRVEDGDRWALIEPSDRLVIDSTIVFDHALIKTQRRVFEHSCENFVGEISRARTFGLLGDVNSLKRRGLVQGASLDNAVVLDDFKVVNPDGFRFRDECVRHKILDTLGDVSLLGHEVVGRITTYKSGHRLNNLLCRRLLATPEAYEVAPSTSFEKDDPAWVPGLDAPAPSY